MGTPFMSEVKIISWNFPPKGWAFCDGQVLPINQNQALFSLMGNMYGGNGQTNFALPDLRGRAPVHVGGGLTQGQAGGEVNHTLSIGEMPQHPHFFQGTTNDANQPVPTGNLFGATSNEYTTPQNLTTLNPATVGNAGGSQAHNNMQPYLVLNYIVALQGALPSHN